MGKLLAIYLMSSPTYCMVGIYEQPCELIRKHLRMTDEQVKSAIEELIASDFIAYDHETEVVWVVDMALSQVSDGRLSEMQQKGVINELARLEIECEFPFVDEFIRHYKPKYPFLPESTEDLYWA